MSYAEELKARYKAARERMLSKAKEKPRTAVILPRPVSPPEPELEVAPEPGLVQEKHSEDVVKDALAVTSKKQSYVVDEVNLPRLKPLPGLVLDEIGAIRWMRIMHAIAALHKVEAKDILGPSRKRHLVNARFELFYRMKTDLGMSYSKIGTLMRRDHSTIMHGVWKVHQKLLDGSKSKVEDDYLAMGTTCRGETAHTQNLVGV